MTGRIFARALRCATILALGAAIFAQSAYAGSRTASQKKEKKASVVTTERIEVAMPMNTLQEPEGRSVRYLASPVVSAQGDILFGVNFLNGLLESWDLSNGALRTPISLPDSLRYFYRTDAADDTVWAAMEGQGFNPARFVSLCVVNRDLYALVSLPAGYTTIPTPIKSDSGTVIMQWPQWKWRQAVVRFEKDSLADMYPLPASYTFISLVTDGKGLIGGICQETESFNRPPADSTVIMALLNVHKGRPVKTVALWKAPGLDMSGMTALTRIAADGTLWYCNPEKPKFFTRKSNGTMKAVELRHSLLKSAGFSGGFGAPIPTLGDSPQQTFRLRSMVPSDNGMLMLLAPISQEASSSPVMQVYDASGVLRSELVLDAASLRASPSTWLLSAHDNEALFLIETSDQRWRIEKMPITLH